MAPYITETLKNKILEMQSRIELNNITGHHATPLTNSLTQVSVIPTSPPLTPALAYVVSEEKPKVFGAVSVMIFLIASIYVFSALSLLAVIFIMGRVEGTGVVFSFLKYFPSFGIVPIVFSFAAFTFYYIALKVREGSGRSFWLGTISLVVIPIFIAYMSQVSMSSFVNQVSESSQAGGSIGSIASGQTRLRLDDPIFILAIVSIVVMVWSHKKFVFKSSSLSKKARIFLLLIIVLFVVPVVGAVSFDYRKALDTDYGYAAATRAVTYHVYRPREVPKGLAYASKVLGGQKLAGKQNAVQLAFDIPLDDMLKDKPLRVTIVRQVGVEKGFNIEDFAATYMEGAVPQKISLPKAANQTAYQLQKPMEQSFLNALLYLTNDNVLIVLISPASTTDQLMQLAYSLE